jgi:NTE family protein
MRGAYEVGVLAGIIQILTEARHPSPFFQIFSGTSVGAINATYLAAHAHKPDYNIDELATIWKSLKLVEHARLRPFGLLSGGLKARLERFTATQQAVGNSLVDTRALEVLVRRSMDWDRLHRNVDEGLVDALLVAALHVASGRTTIFTEHSPTAEIAPVQDERRLTSIERIGPDHVLASAAIPLLFPTRRVGKHYYCDGGLRFNTPIAPAIRSGSERLIVISVRYNRTPPETDLEPKENEGRDLSPLFLVGKLLDALLLDPVEYDLRVLERLNQVMEILEETLPASELERVQRVWIQHRGAPYKRLETLVFTPSVDLGTLAGAYIRESLDLDSLRPMLRYLIERAGGDGASSEADWASFVLFEGGFAERVLEVGLQDALAKRQDVLDFYLGARHKSAFD